MNSRQADDKCKKSTDANRRLKRTKNINKREKKLFIIIILSIIMLDKMCNIKIVNVYNVHMFKEK